MPEGYTIDATELAPALIDPSLQTVVAVNALPHRTALLVSQ
ncbi:hypothetical protein X772_34785 [Mesorhizobium sp. LSJC280B00]|nr:hypothetical protein X772_34785 [Mesorhizobium sp. LSJC280B00]